MTAARRDWLKAVQEQLSSEGLLVDATEIQLARAESAASACDRALQFAQGECLTAEERVTSYTRNVEDAHRKAQTLYTMLDHGLGFEWRKHAAYAALSRTDDERMGHVLAGIMAIRQFDRMSMKAGQYD